MFPPGFRHQRMLEDNYAAYQRRHSRGVPREGSALLQGIAYCGECGHKLSVEYKDGPLYLCSAAALAGLRRCQRLPAAAVDDQVVRWFFEALSVAEIDLSARLLAEADRKREQVLAARRQEVERLRYQANLADRQFRRVHPDNRLVAAELEKRWEEALRALAEAEQQVGQEEAQAPCWAIPADLLEQLRDIGPHLPELWQQKLLHTSQQKALLRTLLDKVVLHRVATDQVRIRVVWRGGLSTTADVRVRVSSWARVSDLEQIRETARHLANAGHSDVDIAQALTTHGHRGPDGGPIRATAIPRLRLKKGKAHRP